MFRTYKMICAGGLLASTAIVPAMAQQIANVAETDIIVTAQKREGRLIDTPLAISAVSGENLAQRQMTSIQALLPTLPNLSMGQNLGIARIAIRGLGLDATVAGQEARVAYHTDGVYVSRPAATLGTFFDISRVEVVRGPQGTLYGRNATAGAVNVITNDPQSTLGGYARVTVGNYGSFTEEAALTAPISDTISARVAFVKTDRNGFGQNFTTAQNIDDEHSFGARLKVKFEPSSVFSLVLSADYTLREDNAFVYHFITAGSETDTPIGQALGGQLANNPRNTYADVPQSNKRRFSGLSATATLDLGFADLTSITAYRDGNYRVIGDADDTDKSVAQIEAFESGNQLSEELRLNGRIDRLDWIVGGYYFRERMTGATRFTPVRSPVPGLGGIPVFGLNFEGNLSTDAFAVFGQLDYEPIDGLTISGGLRYSHEKKGIDQRGATEFARPYDPAQSPNYTGFQNESVTFGDATYRFSIQYKPDDNVSLYANYSTGFKSGGYNFSSMSPPVRPEKLTDYEIGLKAAALDGDINFNLAAFYYDYTDLQVQLIRGAVAVLENAATAKIKGIEGEIVIRPIENLELSGNFGYLDSKFKRYESIDPARPALGLINLSGNRLSQAPRWSGNAAAQYTLPVSSGQVMLRGELQYSDTVFFTPFNRPELSQPSYVKTNATVRYQNDKGWSIAAFIRNISNKRTIAAANISGSFTGFPVMGAYDAPRTFGATAGYSF